MVVDPGAVGSSLQPPPWLAAVLWERCCQETHHKTIRRLLHLLAHLPSNLQPVVAGGGFQAPRWQAICSAMSRSRHPEVRGPQPPASGAAVVLRKACVLGRAGELPRPRTQRC
jgi:hypothetical protein